MPKTDNCIFCTIVNDEDENTEILLKNEHFVVFKDIRPATPHHYLVVTKNHIADAKQLKNKDVQLVEQMVATGQEILLNRCLAETKVRMGFHWPPFHSISHLHLHVIADTDQMGWIARGIFKVNSFWFVSSDWLIERLKKMKKEIDETGMQS